MNESLQKMIPSLQQKILTRNLRKRSEAEEEESNDSTAPARKIQRLDRITNWLKMVELVEKNGYITVAETTNVNDYSLSVQRLKRVAGESLSLSTRIRNGEFQIVKTDDYLHPGTVSEIFEETAGVPLRIQGRTSSKTMTEAPTLSSTEALMELPQELIESFNTNKSLNPTIELLLTSGTPQDEFDIYDANAFSESLTEWSTTSCLEQTKENALTQAAISDTTTSKEKESIHTLQPISFLGKRWNEEVINLSTPAKPTTTQNTPAAFWEPPENKPRTSKPDFSKILPKDYEKTLPRKHCPYNQIDFYPTTDGKYFFYYAGPQIPSSLEGARGRFNIAAQNQGYGKQINFNCDPEHHIIYIDAAGFDVWSKKISGRPTPRKPQW